MGFLQKLKTDLKNQSKKNKGTLAYTLAFVICLVFFKIISWGKWK